MCTWGSGQGISPASGNQLLRAEMPREIITVQLGQCGNQSERLPYCTTCVHGQNPLIWFS